MKKIFGLFILSALVLAAVIGCQNDPISTNSGSFDTPQPVSKFVPSGATLVSATLHIFVFSPNGEEIFIHRVTSPWEELTVTFNSFGGAFVPASSGSFMADASGWKTADVTSLVAGWENGDFGNFGILLDQDEFNTPRAQYRSRDYTSAHPYLEVCYDVNGETVCENFESLADTYIWQIHPDNNYGSDVLLYTGWVAENDYEKQSLIRFEGDYTPEEPFGCTHTIGYWKTHAGFGPQDDVVTPLLPITLGTPGGDHSFTVSDAAFAVVILDRRLGSSSNGLIKLYAQLLGAKLSIADGADGSDIAEFITDADEIIADHSYTEWGSLSKSMQKTINGLMETFDKYNNGLIGPGHCDEMTEEVE